MLGIASSSFFFGAGWLRVWNSVSDWMYLIGSVLVLATLSLSVSCLVMLTYELFS
jgi:hypothetical protein